MGVVALVVLATTCDADSDVALDRGDELASEQLEYESPTAGDAPESNVATPSPVPPRRVEPEPPRTPIGVRIARQMLVLRTAPDHDAPLRGRIPISEAFEVFAYVPGSTPKATQECAGKGWADLGDGAFACLEPSRRAGEVLPRTLPEMRDGDLAPFFYAHAKSGQVARRWKTLASWRADEPHLDVLEPEHDYAFVTRRRVDGELVLIDDRDRVVLEREVTRYRPSRFEGRDLALSPVPEGRILAWTVTWPENAVKSAPAETAALARSLDYQLELLLLPAPIRNDDGLWFELEDGGFIAARDVRRWAPVP
ncbi:MAG TPA: hypothetical protein VFG69_20935, partial [Nannocystaceae bacterium]|nr:hypothetical protein [Nannocystaceae bacterium]